jgi:outer membrane protein OmpA-like peptidoglycan-associated protein
MNMKENNFNTGSRKTGSAFRKIIIVCTFIFTAIQLSAQTYSQPSWYFGVAGAANFNRYHGSAQNMNASFTAPSAFHDGKGTGVYVAPLIEYRPAGSLLGFMLQAGYDSRRGKFNQHVDPTCNCTQDMETDLSYISVEPSLRFSPFRNGFYIYLGPRIGFNLKNQFIYKQGIDPLFPSETTPPVKGEMNSMNRILVNAQAGIGYDIAVTPSTSRTRFLVSPFVAYQPHWGQDPRKVETWEVATVRAGIAFKFGTGRELTPPPPPMPVITDRDGDGIPDADDKCPDLRGLAALQGCPDRDGDGIADGDDKCPDVAGIARYQGCPVPDTDKDGINDELDKCPTVPGVSRYMGCPIPDTDGDGINDEEDKCINDKGPASNFGCPVISEEIIRKVNRAAENIFFVSNSDKLMAKSFPKLNEVVTILTENPSLKVSIEGHTDDVGKDDVNQTLSDDRAAAVKAYLVSKGIAENRLTSAGYGETKPVADNKTAAGRAKNRRVEMILRNY